MSIAGPTSPPSPNMPPSGPSGSSGTSRPPPTASRKSVSKSRSNSMSQRRDRDRDNTAPGPVPLQRVSTGNSFHANNSLRRMATHETGEMVCEDRDGADTLHPHDEEDGEHSHDNSHDSPTDHDTSTPNSEHGFEEANIGLHDDEKSRGTGAGDGDDEKKIKKRKGKKEVSLQDQTNLLPVKQVILVMVGLSCALFCSLLDQTIVTTALPTLGRVFNRADIASWVGTSYLLVSTAMQPIYGRLSDIFGRKFVLLGSCVIFMLGSLACALAQSMIQLIVFRAIQGIGGGGILTLTMIIVSDVVSLRERGKYQGLIGGVVALGNSVGPILGGIFTQSVTWRWCFYINLPLSALAIVIVIFVLPLKRVKGSIMGKLKVLDWYGSILTLSWAVLVLLALSWAGSQYAWDSAGVLAPLIIGLALLGVFIWVEARVVRLPLIPMRIFKTSTASAALFSTLFNGAVFYSTLYYLPTYFQVVRGETAIRSGVLLLPLVLVQTCVSFCTGYLQSKTGDYWYNLVCGFCFWTVGLGLLSTIDVDTSLGKLIGFQIIDGIGAGQTFQTSLMAIQASVAREDMATATGLRNFLRMLGGTLGLAICTVLINNIVRKELATDGISRDLINTILQDPTEANGAAISAADRATILHAYARGIQACFYFMIPCAGICVVLTVLFVKRVSLKREDDAQRKAEGKAWAEARKAKHKAKKHHLDIVREVTEEPHSIGSHGSAHDVSEDESARQRNDSQGTMVDEAGSGRHETFKERAREEVASIEQGMEIAGQGEEEADGVEPSSSNDTVKARMEYQQPR